MKRLMSLCVSGILSLYGTDIPSMLDEGVLIHLLSERLPGTQLIPVTDRVREIACAMPLLADIARHLEITHDISQLQKLCTDVHKGVRFIPQQLLHAALEQALSCLRDIQLRLARELAVHWMISLEQYLIGFVQEQLGITAPTQDPLDDLQIDVWPQLSAESLA